MDQRIDMPSRDSIAGIGSRPPRDPGRARAPDELAGLATASPMLEQGG